MLKPLPDLIKEVSANITKLDAKTALAEFKNSGGKLIDVREPQEAASDVIAQSINVPRGVLEIQIPQLAPEADTPLYLHCATGGRACLAAEQLQRIGYTNVKALACSLSEVRDVWDENS